MKAQQEKLFLWDLNADTVMKDILSAGLHTHLSPLYFFKGHNKSSVQY